MCIRAIQYQYNCRGFHGYASRISNPSYLGIWSTLSPSRRTQEGSKDNAVLRLDSSLETPTVNFPPLFVPVSAYSSNSCMSAFAAISLEVDL